MTTLDPHQDNPERAFARALFGPERHGLFSDPDPQPEAAQHEPGPANVVPTEGRTIAPPTDENAEFRRYVREMFGDYSGGTLVTTPEEAEVTTTLELSDMPPEAEARAVDLIRSLCLVGGDADAVVEVMRRHSATHGIDELLSLSTLALAITYSRCLSGPVALPDTPSTTDPEENHA